MATKKFVGEYKKIKFSDMTEYIEKYKPEDKHWFKELVDENTAESGRLNYLKVKMEFCKKYNPSLIPVAKAKKPKVTDSIADW